MITDRIENLTKYDRSFPIISDLMKIFDSTPLADITKKETFGSLAFVPINSDEVSDAFDKSVLEDHLMPYYRELGWKEGDLPNAENYYKHCISLPMFSTLSKKEQLFVIEKIKTYYNE